MFGYSMKVAQIVDGYRKPSKQGFYSYFKGQLTRYEKAPLLSKVFDNKKYEDMIYEECARIISDFSLTKDNKDVYCLSLYTSEHNDIIVYINNEEANRESVEYYRDKYPRYQESGATDSLRYALGDFEFMFTSFSDSFNRKHDLLSTISEMISEKEYDVKSTKVMNSEVFSAQLFDDSLYYVLGNVLSRLTVDLDKLDKTEDFIMYLSTGDDYIDYNITFRNQCSVEQYYKLMPEMKGLDAKFEDGIAEFDNYDGLRLFDEMFEECKKNTHRTTQDIFSSTIRTEYEGVKYLSARFSVQQSFEIMDYLIENDDKDFNSKIYILSLVLLNQSVENTVNKGTLKKYIDTIENKHDKSKEYSIEYLEDLMIRI